MSGALRITLHRASAQRGVLAVAAVVLLVSVVLVTSCSVALRVASQDSLRTGLDRAAATDRVVVVSGNPEGAEGLATADRAVRAALASGLAPARVDVARRTVSASYAVRGGDPVDRVVLGVYDDVRAHASLVSGSWPSDAGQAAVPRDAATALDLQVGDSLRLLGQDGRVRDVSVVGTWSVDDPAEGFWADDPQGAAGVRRDGGFRTLGPVLLPEDTAAGGMDVLVDPRISWTATPQLTRLSRSGVEDVGTGLDRLESDGPRGLGEDLPDAQVVSRLDDVLRSLGPSLTAARTAVVVPALLLLALAVASLLLAGRVVAEARGADVALRQSRGFSRAQVLRDAGWEALALGLVVLAVAPWVAPALVRAVARRDTTPSLAGQDWVWAGAAVLGAAILLTRAAGGSTGASRATTGWRRLLPGPGAVVEVLVVVLAAIAWQQSTTAPAGRLPSGAASWVLAGAPALLVLALLLLAARLLPAAVRTTGGWVRRTRGLVVPVVGWELTRRVQHHRSALVTTGLAAAVAVLLAGLLGSWTVAQRDQAAVATAARVRVTGLDTALAQRVAGDLGGVAVERRSAGIGEVTGTALVLDRAAAAGVLDTGPDWPALLSRLAPRPAEVPALVSPAVEDLAGGGELLSLRLGEASVRVRVVGVVEGLPTVEAGQPAVLVDTEAARRGLGRVPPPAVSTDDTEVWTDADPARVRAAVPDGAEVLERTTVTDQLRTGPVGTGLVAGSALALVAAVMLAVLASLSDTATALRSRRHELAALRAQGLSGRELVTALVAERAVLLVGAAVLGGLAGWVTLRLLLPRLVVGDTGLLPATVRADVPWLVLVAATALVVVVLLVQVLGSAARAARRSLGTDLREST